MKLTSTFIKLFFTLVLIWFTLLIYNTNFKDPKNKTNVNIKEIYPDSIQVLTITGDTATIFGTAGHRMIKVYKHKSK